MDDRRLKFCCKVCSQSQWAAALKKKKAVTHQPAFSINIRLKEIVESPGLKLKICGSETMAIRRKPDPSLYLKKKMVSDFKTGG